MYADLTVLMSGLLVTAIEQGPEPEDVVAGWTAFAIFGLLIAAIVILGFSLTKRLKNAARAEEEGRYDPSTKKQQQRQVIPETPTDDPQHDGG
jgi:hypothetical protein